MPPSPLKKLSKNPKKIVIVDDNETLLRAWTRLLEESGYLCFTTNNPQEALSLVESEKADLLISDIVMPQMDGFDLIQQLQHRICKPRIVLTTGYVCDFKRLKFEMGAEDIHVLLKPYNDIHQIENFIRRLLEGDETLDEEDSFKSLDDARVHLWNL
jgi:CheY-like chemotaxis protein